MGNGSRSIFYSSFSIFHYLFTSHNLIQCLLLNFYRPLYLLVSYFSSSARFWLSRKLARTVAGYGARSLMISRNLFLLLPSRSTNLAGQKW